MYSICSRLAGLDCGEYRAHLVAPEQTVAMPVLQPVPDGEELLYAVLADVVGIALGVFPGVRRSESEEPHC
jgi:hypothetical protein